MASDSDEGSGSSKGEHLVGGVDLGLDSELNLFVVVEGGGVVVVAIGDCGCGDAIVGFGSGELDFDEAAETVHVGDPLVGSGEDTDDLETQIGVLNDGELSAEVDSDFDFLDGGRSGDSDSDELQVGVAAVVGGD